MVVNRLQASPLVSYDGCPLCYSLITIGEVRLNTNTGKIVGFVKRDTLRSEATLEPTVVSRWLSVDPVVHPYESPYAAFANNPIYLIDPDGREIVVAGKDQKLILSYLEDQFGSEVSSEVFKFDKKNRLKVNYGKIKKYRDEGILNLEQKQIGFGLSELAKSKKYLEVLVYHQDDINFHKNPTVAIEYEENGELRTRYEPLYKSPDGKAGVRKTKLMGGGGTVEIPGHSAYVLLNTSRINETFEAEGGGRTDPCASCLFLHEVLDHGLDFERKNSINDSLETKKEQVEYQNKALKNKGSVERSGNDH